MASTRASTTIGMFDRCRQLPIVPALLVALAEAAAAFSLLFIFLQGWRRDFRTPLYFSYDALEYLMQVKGTLENGWWWVHPRLSAPGVFEQIQYPSNTHLDQGIVRLVGLFTVEPGLAINVTWMVMVVLSALVASRCLMRVGSSRRVAVALGLVYALSPYALYKQIDHFSLATYLVPCAGAVALLLATGRLGSFRRPDVWPLLAGAVLLGLNYTYYPFFACFLILVASFIGSAAVGRWRETRQGLVIVGVISLATAINLAPSMYAWARDGRPASIPVKRAAESEQYGLKIRQLVSPMESLPFLRRWTDLESAAHFPLENENQSSRLGLIATIGFLASLLSLFVPRLSGIAMDRPLFMSAGRLSLALVLLATVGGFGSVFSLLVSPEIRAYNRVTPFISFFSLAAIALVAERLLAWAARRQGRRWVPIAMVYVVLIGLYDQAHATERLNLAHEDIHREWIALRRLVRSLEDKLPRGAMVFEMPSSTYLTETGHARMLPYDPIKPYLVSNHVHWSYPALADSVVRWQQQVSRLPAALVPAALRDAGFRAVLIDRYGYADSGQSLVTELGIEASSRAVLAENDRYIALDLEQVRRVEIPGVQLPRFGAVPVASTAGLPPCGAATAYTLEWVGNASTPFEQQPVSVTRSDPVQVSGWAVDEPRRSVAGDVDVVVGNTAIPAFYGGDRSDVATVLQKDVYRQSGFVARLSGVDLRPGAYPLSIRILAADRTCFYEGASVSILVQ